jgi:hypothetical protein
VNRGTLSGVAKGLKRQKEAHLIEEGGEPIQETPGGQMEGDEPALLQCCKDLVAILAQKMPDTRCIMGAFRWVFLL